MKLISAQGLVGEAQLREAAATELGQIMGLVGAALQTKLGQTQYFGTEAMYPDRVIINQAGRYFSYPYTIGADNQVTLGAPQEVVEQYLPVRESIFGEDALFKEAAGSEGKVWDVILVRAGRSLNNVFYSDAVLREAAPLFEGTRCYVKADDLHADKNRDTKDPEKIFGWFSGVKFVEGKTTDTGYLTAQLNVAAGMSALRETIADAWKRGKKDLVALSINAYGKIKTAARTGAARVAESIRKVSSVDLIVEPGAGGALVRMVEAANPEEEHDMNLKQRMLEAIKTNNPEAFAKIDPATVTDDALEAAYREAVSGPKKPAGVTQAAWDKMNFKEKLQCVADEKDEASKGTAAAMKEAASGKDEPVTREELRMVEARAHARVTIAGCSLPQAAREKLLSEFGVRERFTEADVDSAIKAERQYLAKFTESGKVKMDDDGNIQVEDRSAKIADMFNAFFDTAHKNHRSVQSFKECYIEMTGDKRVTGRMDQVDRARLAESTGARFAESMDSTSLANVLGDSITRRMVAEYNIQSQYDAWRQIATTVPVQDFRTQDRTLFGGYGDLPAVVQGAPYAALASPTDAQATYGVTKRGGTEDITLEMIKNDDVGAIRRIPIKLGRSAKRTLAKFVFDFIRTNPLIYDGVALFDNAHSNLGTTALSAAELGVARRAMMKQTELSSGDRMSIPPKSILVPLDLQEAAWNIFQRGTNLDKTFIETMLLQIIPVWYWTDVTDWAIAADPADLPGIEVGFLDGQEEPELFVQDMPNVGSMFSNDKLTYKIRHIYGGNVLPGGEKAFFKEVVAG
jgi:hypothetical protein